MRTIGEIKNDQMKLCYDLVLEKNAYALLIKLIDTRVEELEYALVNNSETDKGYEIYKSIACERIVLKELLNIIQQGAVSYNNQIKGAKNE